MDELVQLVSQKTGLSEDMSRQATEVVLDYLKQKLPGPVASQLENILEGGTGGAGLDDLTKGLGDMFGG